MNRWVASSAPVERQRDGSRGVALQVDHVERELTDLDGVAVGQDAVRFDRQRVGVQLVRRGGHPGRLGHLGQRQPVVLVLVAGDDQCQLRREALDELEQDLGVVGGVDE